MLPRWPSGSAPIPRSSTSSPAGELRHYHAIRLHYERHHAGIPNIDPARHRLVIHGMVDRPIKYSLADLKRFPTVSRTYLLECSGTTHGQAIIVAEAEHSQSAPTRRTSLYQAA